MGTTTKMSIPYPEATGLVKDGWEDMKDIATQVDAKSGLILLSSTSVSAVTSQSFNSAFSSTFNNYKIYFNLTTSGTTDIQLRLRTGTTDNTNASYRWGVFVKQVASATLANDSQSNGGTFIPVGYNSTEFGVGFDLFNPFLSVRTQVHSQNVSTGGNLFYFAGFFDNSTSFDGFTLLTTGGQTMTGTISIFGVNK